jgi:hypothetical protein
VPFQLEVFAAEEIARATATGHIQFEDIRRHMSQVRQAGAARFPELIDVTRADSVAFTMRDLLSLASFAYNEFGSGFMAPRAIVVGSRRHFEWARMFAGFVAGWLSVGVFTDRREAMLWLEHKTVQIREPAVRRAAVG